MENSYGHHHNHHSLGQHDINNAFIIGIILNFLFVIVEACAGFISHSLSLLSDAGHNLSDVATLGLSLFALRLAKVKTNERFTYGFKKTTVLVAFLNSVILLLAMGGVIYEAFLRFFHPEPIPGKTMAIVALAGIGVNAFTAFLFFKK